MKMQVGGGSGGGMVSAEMRATIIAVVSLIISFVCVVLLVMGRVGRRQQLNSAQPQYVMYVGTIDKDNMNQIPSSEAQKTIEDVLVQHFDNFTMRETDGVWTTEDGTVVHGPMYMVIIHGGDTKELHAAASELNTKLNIADILIEHDEVFSEYYSQRV